MAHEVIFIFILFIIHYYFIFIYFITNFIFLKKVVYCTNDGLIFKQNWIIHNGRAYVVSFVSQHKQFHTANKLVTELILSFRLLS